MVIVGILGLNAATASRVVARIPNGARTQRFDSIDQAHGTIMIVMALDHARCFFTDISVYQPETLANTNLWLFLTRWVRHYCAPGFLMWVISTAILYGVCRQYAMYKRSHSQAWLKYL